MATSLAEYIYITYSDYW